VKTLKILGLAAALVLLGSAVAYATGQVIDEAEPDDTTAGRVCSENCLRTNNPEELGVEVRTHTRTRLAWDEAAECDGDQTRLRTQARDSWTDEDEATRTLTQTRSSQATEDPGATEGSAAAAAGPNGPGDGSCD
jgi:hypothetical protein